MVKKYLVVNPRFSPDPVDTTLDELRDRIAELCGPMQWDVPGGIELVETEGGIETMDGELVALPK